MSKTAWIGVLLTIVAVFCFVSCSQNNEDDELEKFEELIEALESEDTEVVAAEPFADRVYVIIPKSASAELKAKALELSEAIHSKTEVEAMVKYDYEDIYAYDDDILIFVGKTDSMLSKEATALLRKGEYLCKWSKQDIVLAARDDEAAIAAVDEFIKTIIPGASNAALMSEGAHFEHKVDYDISSITVNGYDLYDFSLVCTEDTLEKVSVLNRYIVEKSGYLMDIFCDDDKVDGKHISFAFDLNISGSVIEQVGQDIEVRAVDEYALSMVIAEMASLIFENVSDGVASLDIYGAYEISSFNKELKICSAYYLNNGVPYIDQISGFPDAIRTNGFDLIVIGDLSRESYGDISLNIPEKYEIINAVSENGDIFCAIYRSTAFDSVSCKFSQGLFLVDITVSGEDISRRVIRADRADAEALKSIASTGDEYDTVLLGATASEQFCEALQLESLGEHTWGFDGQQFVCTVLNELALKSDSNETEVIKEAGGGYMNLFVYSDIFVEYCAEFEKLKNTVN